MKEEPNTDYSQKPTNEIDTALGELSSSQQRVLDLMDKLTDKLQRVLIPREEEEIKQEGDSFFKSDLAKKIHSYTNQSKLIEENLKILIQLIQI